MEQSLVAACFEVIFGKSVGGGVSQQSFVSTHMELFTHFDGGNVHFNERLLTYLPTIASLWVCDSSAWWLAKDWKQFSI